MDKAIIFHEKEKLLSLKKEVREELLEHIIPFWLNLKDDENGGFYGQVDYDLALQKNADKGCILNSRILWFFSNAYLLTNDKNCLALAHWAYDFLCAHFLDEINGGVIWSVASDGSARDTTKHTYNQAFALYALSSYFEASKESHAIVFAKELFNLIEEKCTENGFYCEAFTKEFLPQSNEKLSENGVMASHTMNTLLHILEAYTNLYRVAGDSSVKARLCEILLQFESKIWNPEKHRQEVFFDKNFNSLIDLHSYGHDIEASWLLDESLGILNESHYTALISPITEELSENVLKTAYDKGSVANECERGLVDETRVWWVQAESVVGFFNAWQKGLGNEFLDAAIGVWDFIKANIIDKRAGGEWFWSVDINGRAKTEPIVEPWKCPYHNGRMCFEIIKRVDKMMEVCHD